jgi:hypothetical protein
MTAGVYTLLDYDTLTGSAANLGSPSGPGSYNYQLLDSGSTIDLQISLLGDFNLDGSVDGGDYVVWRKGLGTTYTQAHYDVWLAHFGESVGSGAASGSAVVPEPAAVTLLLFGVGALLGRRKRYGAAV